MSENEKNGPPPGRNSFGPGTDEEWERHWAEVEAKTPARLNEEEREQYRDIQWALYEPEVERRYADKVVAVHRRQVIASGENSAEVLAEAERITGLPANRIAVVFIDGPNSTMAGH